MTKNPLKIGIFVKLRVTFCHFARKVTHENTFVYHICIAPNRNLLVSTDRDFFIIDYQNGNTLRHYTATNNGLISDRFNGVAVSQDGRFILLATGPSSLTVILDGSVVETITDFSAFDLPSAPIISHVIFNPVDHSFYVITRSGNLLIFDINLQSTSEANPSSNDNGHRNNQIVARKEADKNSSIILECGSRTTKSPSIWEELFGRGPSQRGVLDRAKRPTKG